jgi:CBS domain-containing protein
MDLVLPQVKDVMSSPMWVIGEEETVGKALARMRKHNIRRLPVVSGTVKGDGEPGEGANLVGIITLDEARNAAGDAGEDSTEGVHTAMSSPVHTVKAGDLLDRAVTLMHVHKIAALPVTSYGKLGGMITESDVFRWLAGTLDFEGQASWQ